MVWTVSVRDTKDLEEKLRAGKPLNIPEECVHNSRIIYTILQYADKVLPQFSLLTDSQKQTMCDSVAYLMRTDLLIQECVRFVGPNRLRPVPDHKTDQELVLTLMNDPTVLNEEWDPFWYGKSGKVEHAYSCKAAELFRCYVATISWMPGMYDLLDPKSHSLAPAFSLADVTAFLLCPDDLVDYRYTPADINQFNATIEREMEEI